MEKRRKKTPTYSRFYFDTLFNRYDDYRLLSKRYSLSKDEAKKLKNLTEVIDKRPIRQKLYFYRLLKDDLRDLEKTQSYEQALELKDILDDYVIRFLG